MTTQSMAELEPDDASPATTADPVGSADASDSAGLADSADSADSNTLQQPASAGEAKKTPGILQLAWPAIAGNLLYSLVGIVDIKIVGSLGAPAVAAVTTGNRLFFVLQGLMMAVTAGTTAMVARAWGADDRAEAERITFASFVLCAVLGLFMMIPGVFFSQDLASFFRLEPETQRLAADFIFWLSLFNVSFAVAFVLGAAMRAAGDTMTPLWIGAITNVVNVFLVYSLVYGEFGFPELGVTGAAIASGTAFSVGALVTLGLWLSGGLVVGIRTRGALAVRRFRQLIHIGYPAGLEQAVWNGGFIGFLWVVALYGTAPYAAYGIGTQILSLSFVVGFGFSIAASTHVGQRLGAGDPDGAAQSGWRALRLAVISMIVLGATIVMLAPTIANLLIDDPEVVRLTVAFIYILGAVQPLMAIEFTLGGALRGAGDTRFPLYTVLTGLIGVRITLACLAAWLGLSVVWVFAALIADYIVKSSLLTWRFASGRWKTIQVG